MFSVSLFVVEWTDAVFDLCTCGCWWKPQLTPFIKKKKSKCQKMLIFLSIFDSFLAGKWNFYVSITIPSTGFPIACRVFVKPKRRSQVHRRYLLEVTSVVKDFTVFIASKPTTELHKQRFFYVYLLYRTPVQK